MPDTVEVLGKAEVLRSLPYDALQKLVDSSYRIELSAGEAIHRAGRRSNALFVLKQGMLGVFANFRNWYEVPCLVLGPGRVVGLTSLLQRQAANLTARAMMSSTVIAVPAEMVQVLMLTDKENALSIHEELIYALHHRYTNLVRALAGEEVSFAQEELCPSERPTRFLASANTVTGEIRGMCQRRLECTVEQGMGCPMAGKDPLEFVTILPPTEREGALSN